MAQPRLCVIHNPTAGRGFARRFWRLLQGALGRQAEFRVTTKPMQAISLARQAAEEGFATVAAAGGDGTVHEVANGLLQARQTGCAFGVIPLGSGNDYARMLQLPRSPSDLARLLLGDAVWPVDAGTVETDGGRRQRFFVNTVGFGMSGAVTWESRNIRSLKGIPLYGLAALKAIFRHFRAIDTRIHFDDTAITGATLYLSIGLGRSEGAGFVVAPEAQLDDGWFDTLHATRMSRLAAVGMMPRMLLGKLPGDGPVRRGRCKLAAIAADEPLMCHVDGELFSDPTQPAQDFLVRLLPAALRLRVTPPKVRR